ncbi:MAG: hypothetical protein RSE41_07980 [Clostridia bacterium]
MEQLILNSLDKLEKMEKEHGMLGTIIGILIILSTLTVSYFVLKILVQVNIEIISYVCENYFNFKL